MAALVCALVSAGDVVLDIGANVGDVTAAAACSVGPSGSVHAFEPNPACWSRLTALAASFGNITVHRYGLSDRDAEAALHIPVGPTGPVAAMGMVAVPRSRADLAYVIVPVRLRRLDHVLRRRTARTAVIKCDVEGHELPALRAARAVLRDDRPVVVVEIEQRHTDHPVGETFDFLRGLGFDGYGVRGAGVFPLSEFDVRRDQLALLPAEPTTLPDPAYVNNFLFLPREQPYDLDRLLRRWREGGRPRGHGDDPGGESCHGSC